MDSNLNTARKNRKKTSQQEKYRYFDLHDFDLLTITAATLLLTNTQKYIVVTVYSVCVSDSSAIVRPALHQPSLFHHQHTTVSTGWTSSGSHGTDPEVVV